MRRSVRKRKFIVYVAVSADGFIARPDGSVDWLDRPHPKGNYGMGAFYRSIWLVGGAELVAAFLDSEQVDEFIIHVIPKMIGEGIPLVAARHRDLGLKLLATKSFPDGVVKLHYAARVK